MTTETSNARGEVVAWIEPVAGTIRKYTPEQYESSKDMLHKHGWRPLVYGDTAPPSAPVGVEARAFALWHPERKEYGNVIVGDPSLLREDYKEHGYVIVALAQQPAARVEFSDEVFAVECASVQQSAAVDSHCSDERPCTPCYSNSGPCEDKPHTNYRPKLGQR